jgi:hypothetical protein
MKETTEEAIENNLRSIAISLRMLVDLKLREIVGDIEHPDSVGSELILEQLQKEISAVSILGDSLEQEYTGIHYPSN